MMLERKLESKAAETDGDAAVGIRRIEVITGKVRRREWSGAERSRILLESLEPGINISEVARRNGLSPQQLFAWRREARALIQGSVAGDKAAADVANAPTSAVPSKAEPPSRAHQLSRCASGSDKPAASFARIMIASSAPPSAPVPAPNNATCGRIEIAVGDCIVRVVGPVDASALAAVIKAVRRAS